MASYGERLRGAYLPLCIVTYGMTTSFLCYPADPWKMPLYDNFHRRVFRRE